MKFNSTWKIDFLYFISMGTMFVRFPCNSLFQDSSKLLAWEENEAVSEIIAEKSQPVVRRYKVPVPGGFEARVRLLIPPNADLSGATKYPMLIFVWVISFLHTDRRTQGNSS